MTATSSVPVDLFNPGQVFACLGLMELTESLRGTSRAAFEWSEGGDARFLLQCSGEVPPVETALTFLAGARVSSMTPTGSGLATEKWGIPTTASAHMNEYPAPTPSSPASLAALLENDGVAVLVHAWGDARQSDCLATGRDNAKFWGGAGGYPGAALLRDALDAVRADLPEHAADPFAIACRQSSSFRFDWRRDYIPIDAGFSLNDHADIEPLGYPLVEVLAAIGLTHARPLRLEKLRYRYGVVGLGGGEAPMLLPPTFVRAALGCASLPFPMRTLTMHLGWPGKKNQSRCITTVFEEPTE